MSCSICRFAAWFGIADILHAAAVQSPSSVRVGSQRTSVITRCHGDGVALLQASSSVHVGSAALQLDPWHRFAGAAEEVHNVDWEVGAVGGQAVPIDSAAHSTVVPPKENMPHTHTLMHLPQQLEHFRQFDADGSGTYDISELAAFMQGFQNTSQRGLQKLMQRADLDGDSAIGYEEFLECVVSPANCISPLPQESRAVATVLRRNSPPDALDAWGTEVEASTPIRPDTDAWAVMRMWAQESPAVYGKEAVLQSRSRETILKLHLMKDKGLNGTGATCLDGSDAGFYFAPAADPRNAKDWIILFSGGAWCSTPYDCLRRSYTELGSSKHLRGDMYMGGIMSDNCTVNPRICNFNRVVVAYCDGTSFTGDRAQPLVVPVSNSSTGEKERLLYFRGHRILEALLDTLMTMGLDSAEQLLITGASAGGLTALLHADRIRERLLAEVPSLQKVRNVPLSGFFLRHNSVENEAVFPLFMQRMTQMANSTPSLNRQCLSGLSAQARWMCVFAEVAYAFTETPTFIVNSALDSWSTLCILLPSSASGTLEISGQGQCGRSHGNQHYPCASNVEACSPFEMFAMNQLIRDFQATLEGVEPHKKPGHGGFIHSCHTHVEALNSNLWQGIKIRGVSLQQAVLKWWNSDSAPSKFHSYAPCIYRQGGAAGKGWPYQCNPTCHGLPP
mmetsp:Transcript_116913/g.355704  ORF Transcript_116913/g.355704 Transcript_116913/m.355704 type:complete len:675 (+) Transcript_116913:134-2158(+)